MDISSSDIRVRMREGKSVGHLVPSAVAGILSKKQIYQ
jgi:nicotinic acid mononucleotide adenylyltransferase